MKYYEVLDQVHRMLIPRTYLEVGVRNGHSAMLALDATAVVGVDPEPRILVPLPQGAVIEECTSDHFFASGRAEQHFGDRRIDLAFLDGMHHWEYALRDLMNVERFASPDTVVLIHDCLPPGEVEARRTRETPIWSGDVWKLLLWLRDERPDLDVTVLDARPSGLGVVRGFGRAGSESDSSLSDDMVEQYTLLEFDRFEDDVRPTLRVLTGDWPSLREAFPVTPFQSGSDVDHLVAMRAARSVGWELRLRRLRRQLVTTRWGRAANGLRRKLVLR